MSKAYSLEELADSVQAWCEENRVLPANGQAGETITERTIRYYRTIGLLDAPVGAYVKTFTEKHRLQLLAIRLYQAQGLPLRLIREQLCGRTEERLREMVRKPVPRKAASFARLESPLPAEQWTVIPLSEHFLLVSREGRTVSPAWLLKLQRPLAPSHDRNHPSLHAVLEEGGEAWWNKRAR